MEASNPYNAPKSKVTDAPSGYGDIKIFTAKGRIGRVRYIGYSICWSILIAGVLALIVAIVGKAAGWELAEIFMSVGYVGILIVMMLLTIQRAHDLNASGWVALVAFIPLVNLLFLFIPGTNGENRFGPQTPPNGAGAVALALIFPTLFVVGIVAAVALPAYQQYLQRAAATQNK